MLALQWGITHCPEWLQPIIRNNTSNVHQSQDKRKRTVLGFVRTTYLQGSRAPECYSNMRNSFTQFDHHYPYPQHSTRSRRHASKDEVTSIDRPFLVTRHPSQVLVSSALSRKVRPQCILANKGSIYALTVLSVPDRECSIPGGIELYAHRTSPEPRGSVSYSQLSLLNPQLCV